MVPDWARADDPPRGPYPVEHGHADVQQRPRLQLWLEDLAQAGPKLRGRRPTDLEAADAGQASIEVPPDLAAALAAEPRAQAMFDVLTSQNRYAVLYRVHAAVRADTRARRIDQYVAMVGRGETIYPQKRRPTG